MTDFAKILATAAMVEDHNAEDFPELLPRAGKEIAFSRAIDPMDGHSLCLLFRAVDLMLGRRCRSPVTNDPKILKDYDVLARHLGASVTAEGTDDGIQLHLSPTGRGRLH